MLFVKLSKHDRYVEALANRISKDYDFLQLHVPIRNSKRMLGEIDVVAVKQGQIDLYEVKCSHRIIKAKRQLRKLRKNLHMSINHMFFFCGSSGMIIDVEA